MKKSYEQTWKKLNWNMSDETLSKQVKELLDDGADVNAKSDEMWTPLHFASRDGKTEVVEILIAAKADVNALATVNDDGEKSDKWAPLHLAARNKHLEIIDKLIANGADIDAQNGDGDTPIHLAGRYGYPSTVAKLIEYGANTNLENNAGRTVMDEARYMGVAVVLCQKDKIRAEYLEAHPEATKSPIKKPRRIARKKLNTQVLDKETKQHL